MNKREVEFDPEFQEDPERDLTLAIRMLRMGESVRLPNGTMVRSIAVTRGPHKDRRFAVVPPGTALARHRALVLGYGACNSAAEAATKALEAKDAA